MTNQPDVLYVPELAAKLGRTHAAIRMAVARRSPSIPKPFKLGRRITWRRADVDKWLEKLAKG